MRIDFYIEDGRVNFDFYRIMQDETILYIEKVQSDTITQE